MSDYRIVGLLDCIVINQSKHCAIDAELLTATSTGKEEPESKDLLALAILTSMATSSPWLLWEYFISDKQRGQDNLFLRSLFVELENNSTSL